MITYQIIIMNSSLYFEYDSEEKYNESIKGNYGKIKLIKKTFHYILYLSSII